MKRYMYLIMTIVIVLNTLMWPMHALENDNANLYYAEILDEVGLFKGTNKGYELERTATRIEGLVMLVRLLGKEGEALAMGKTLSMFKDVPEWGDPYVNYAFEKGLTKGISHDAFGSNDALGVKDYLTFVLRALGYSDSGGDFAWSDAITFAKEKGIIQEDYFNTQITRGEVAKISFHALTTRMMDQKSTMAVKLVAQGDLNQEDLSKLVIIYEPQYYGAKGDGKHDDSDAFIKLIQAASEYGVINLKGGNYHLGNRSITISQPIKILGPGKLINGRLMIKKTSGFAFDKIETENFSLMIKDSSKIQIKDSSFTKIKADLEGFIYLEGAASEINISKNTFSHIEYLTSSSTYGAGIKINVVNANVNNLNISHNNFEYIHGPAAIWIGGSNCKMADVTIASNVIQNTESFGIELFRYNGVINFKNTHIYSNKLYNIGSARKVNYGNGASAIYNNLFDGDLYVNDNEIKKVLEVGIEGYYTKVENNYIEDTGADQLNRPIMDSAGIYTIGPIVRGNTIVNPGYYGGIHKFDSGIISGKEITNNIIKNVFQYWKPNTHYQVNDLVVINSAWYRCIKSGTSAVVAPSGKLGNIQDGSLLWDYKKPLAQQAINLNAEKGIEKLVITDNLVVNVPTLMALSSLNHTVLIKNNHHDISGLMKGEAIIYLGGYGNRTGETIKITE